MTEELLFLSCHDIALDFLLYLDFLKKLEMRSYYRHMPLIYCKSDAAGVTFLSVS